MAGVWRRPAPVALVVDVVDMEAVVVVVVGMVVTTVVVTGMTAVEIIETDMIDATMGESVAMTEAVMTVAAEGGRGMVIETAATVSGTTEADLISLPILRLATAC